VRLSALLLCLFLGLGSLAAQAASPGKIVKVLPHYLDREGRMALSPSLFDRDAYQAILRQDRSLCSALRFDVQWKAKKPSSAANLKLRVELVTSTVGKDRPMVLDQPVRRRAFGSRWTKILLEGESFRAAGDLVAWRVSLWNGDQLLAEQRSFLW